MLYQNTRPREIVKARKSLPVAYLPLGVLEWHGFHNPLGLDGIKAESVLNYLGERLGGIVMPPLYWGDNRQMIAEVLFDEELSDWLPQGFGDHVSGINQAMGIPRERMETEGQRSLNKGGWRLWQELVEHMLFQIESFGFKMIVVYPGHYPLMQPLQNSVASYANAGGECQLFVLDDHSVGEGEGAEILTKFEVLVTQAITQQGLHEEPTN